MTAQPEVTPEEIERAVEVLKSGGLVAFPTETVYGLGGDAENPLAVARIFTAKGRPSTHPVIVHISGMDAISGWAVDLPDAAHTLARAFWPGPLTLVLKRGPRADDAITGGQQTVALRSPSHPVARELLRAFGGGIAAPSANRFGHISPTQAEHVREELGSQVDLILDGGACEVGIESTIVDLSRGEPVILRPGRVSAEDIAKALDVERVPIHGAAAPEASAERGAATGNDPLSEATGEPAIESAGAPANPPVRAAGARRKVANARSDAPRTPGSHASHYAPRAAMKVMPRREFTDELSRHRGQRIAVLALEISVPRVPAGATRVLPASAALYARDLYAKLRELDNLGADLILVEAPPATASWTAVRDRLARAAHPHAIGPRAERHSHPWQVSGRRAPPAAGGAAAEAGNVDAENEAGGGADGGTVDAASTEAPGAEAVTDAGSAGAAGRERASTEAASTEPASTEPASTDAASTEAATEATRTDASSGEAAGDIRQVPRGNTKR